MEWEEEEGEEEEAVENNKKKDEVVEEKMKKEEKTRKNVAESMCIISREHRTERFSWEKFRNVLHG